MNKLTENFSKTAGPHFVSLSCVQKVNAEADEHIVVVSGFLVEISGLWLYVTAGHVIRQIEAAMSAGSQFDVWRLGDQTAGNKFKNQAIPFDFNIEDWVVIEDEELGLDYAAVVLGELYCRALEAGGVIPITRNEWGSHAAESHHWAVVGIPNETVTYDGVTLISARLVLLPLIPTSAPEIAGKKSENQLYAAIKEGSEEIVNNIAGMSGSPIFSLTKSGGVWRYSVIGVRSAWYPSSRLVIGCPFSSFSFALAEAIDAAKTDAQKTKKA